MDVRAVPAITANVCREAGCRQGEFAVYPTRAARPLPHQLDIEHERLTFPFQALDHQLTDVEKRGWCGRL